MTAAHIAREKSTGIFDKLLFIALIGCAKIANKFMLRSAANSKYPTSGIKLPNIRYRPQNVYEGDFVPITYF